MKISSDYPPNIDRIRQFLSPPENAVFAYGDIIYSPKEPILYPDLIEHEQVHERQQNGFPEQWWERYLQDKDFRLNQEVEAYRTQYQYLKKIVTVKDLKMFLFEFAKALSTDYNLNITYQQAENLIRKNG